MQTIIFIVTILLLIFSQLCQAASCQAARGKLQILGTGGPELLVNRASSSHLI